MIPSPASGEPVAFRSVDVRLVFIAVAAWVGAIVGLNVGETGRNFMLVSGAVMGVGAAFLAAYRRSVLALQVVVVVVAFGLALGVASISAAKFLSDPVTISARQSEFVRVRAKVLSEPRPSSFPWSSNSATVGLQSLSVDLAGRSLPSSVELWAQIGIAEADDFVPGSTVLVRGIVSAEDWLSAPTAGKIRVVSHESLRPAPWWDGLASKLRSGMREATASSGSAGALIRGMAIGDDSGMGKDLKDAMLTSSLTHLTAVSGSHIAISLGLITRVFRGRRSLQAGATFLFLVVIVVVVGPEPSVIRSVFMSVLAVAGMLMHRPAQPLGLLAAVVLGSVLIEPWLAISLGFALSALATAGIILMARPITRRIQSYLPESGAVTVVGNYLAEAIGISVSAFISTLPVLALINPWIPLWGVLANVLVAPIVAPLTLLSLAAVALLWFPAAATLLFRLAMPLASWLEMVAVWVSRLPLARFPWQQGTIGVVMATGFVTLCLFAWGSTAKDDVR